MILRYDSPAQIRQAAIDLKIRTNFRTESNKSWFNNETIDQCLNYTAFGNDQLVPLAETFMEHLHSDVDVKRPSWQPNVAGAFANVPDYCRGVPTSMRRLSYETNDAAKINIVVATTSSAGIPADIIAKRGAAILALVMKLSETRPISLYQLAMMHGRDTGETVIVTQINTAPLDLATACYILTSSGYDRYLTHHIGAALNGFNGFWPNKYISNEEQYQQDLIPRLGFIKEDTIFVKPTYLTDILVTKPIAWINQQIDRFNTINEED